MCGRRVLFIMLPFLCGLISSQNITETLITEDTTNKTNETVLIDPDLAIVNKTCATPREVSGICVQRKFCDHGTPAIDMTLYAPRGFITECPSFKGDIVCCPPDYLVVPPAMNPTGDLDSEFTFDDDDDD